MPRAVARQHRLSCWCGSRRWRPIVVRPVQPGRKAGPRATRASGPASRSRAGRSASPCRQIRRSRPLRSGIASTDVPERAAFRISISSSRQDPVPVRLRQAPDSGTGQDRQTDPITFRSMARSARTRQQPAQWRSAIFPDAVTAAASGRRQKTKRENERRHTRHTIQVDQSWPNPVASRMVTVVASATAPRHRTEPPTAGSVRL